MIGLMLLRGAFDALMVRGTDFVDPGSLHQRLTNLQCRSKSENVAGLQLADLVVTPTGRYVIGKPTKEDFEIVRRKFRGAPYKVEGRGLVVLPES